MMSSVHKTKTRDDSEPRISSHKHVQKVAPSNTCTSHPWISRLTACNTSTTHGPGVNFDLLHWPARKVSQAQIKESLNTWTTIFFDVFMVVAWCDLLKRFCGSCVPETVQNKVSVGPKTRGPTNSQEVSVSLRGSAIRATAAASPAYGPACQVHRTNKKQIVVHSPRHNIAKNTSHSLKKLFAVLSLSEKNYWPQVSSGVVFT